MTTTTVTSNLNNTRPTCCCGSLHIVTGANFFAYLTIIVTLIAMIADFSIDGFQIAIYASFIIPSLLVIIGNVYEDPVYLLPAMLAEIFYCVVAFYFFIISFVETDVHNPYKESLIKAVRADPDAALVFTRISVILAFLIIIWKLNVYKKCVDYLVSRYGKNTTKPKTSAAKSSQPGVYPHIV